MKEIFIVEDDPSIREVLRVLLEEASGATVTEVANGEEAVRYIQAHDAPSVVLLDFLLSGHLTGLDVVHSIRAQWKQVPVVLIPASPERPGARAAAPLVEAVLPKPFDVDALLEMVEQLAGEACYVRAGNAGRAAT
jgi:CheY-like chemotaxis protein